MAAGNEDGDLVPKRGIEPAGSPLPAQEPPDSSLIEDLSVAKEQIRLDAARSLNPDEIVRQPFRWVNAHLAWVGGILFFCLISLRIAAFASLNASSITSVIDNANVQAISLQLIPYTLPTVLTVLVGVITMSLPSSKSHLAIAIYVVIASLATLVDLFIAPLVTAIFLIVTLIVYSYSFYVMSRRVHRKRHFDETIAFSTNEVKHYRKTYKTYFKLQSRIAARTAAIEEAVAHGASDEECKRFKAELDKMDASWKDIQESIAIAEQKLKVASEILSELQRTTNTPEVSSPGLSKERKIWNSNPINYLRTHRDAILPSALLTPVVLSILLGVISAPPWMPVRNYRIDNGQSVVGYQLTESPAITTVLLAHNSKIDYIKTSSIRSEDQCVLYEASVFTESTFQYFVLVNNQPNYPKCPTTS